ncbi:hypothetical protein F5Y06DRAFT_271061 [Hypoxylon sp. FL0890]|nr:hypothetical protein F5Y06DRAFT_271061 [Hypoxylon sp. FL0890]
MNFRRSPSSSTISSASSLTQPQFRTTIAYSSLSPQSQPVSRYFVLNSKMHPLTLVIAMSAAVLALPQPLPAGQALTDTILDGVNGILGAPNRHNAKCHYRNKEDLSACINQCVDEFCLVDPAGCNSCIRGCSKSLLEIPR